MRHQQKGLTRLGLLLAAVIVTALAAFAFLRWRRVGFEWAEFAGTFRQLRWEWLAASIVLALLTYAGRALRWRVLLKPLRRDAKLWDLISATAIGFTAIVLFGRPGEFVRPYLIAIKEQVPFSSQVAAWCVERLYDVLIALLLFGFALSHVQHSGVAVGRRLEWLLRSGGYAAGAIGVLCLFILFAFGRYAPQMRQRILEALQFLPGHVYGRVEQAADAFVRGMEESGKRTVVSQLVLYSLAEWSLIVASYLCILRSVPATAHFTLTDVVLIVGFTAFGAVFQIPGVGGGTQVAIVVVLTELYRVPLEASSGLAILIWIATFVVIVPLGLLLAFHEGLTWGKLRGIRPEVQA